MSRSGYVEDCLPLELGRWRAQVNNSIRGRRGQRFLKELLAALESLPSQELIAGELVTATGEVCAIGAVCQARSIDVSNVDYDDPDQVAAKVGISWQMAAEIVFMNDEYSLTEGPSTRWSRMLRWAKKHIKEKDAE